MLKGYVHALCLSAILLCAGCDSGSSDGDSDPVLASDALVAAVQEVAIPLSGEATGYDPLMQLIGNASVVLIGEASHGTEEFYRERARITQRLIREKGFAAVAIEGDWPDAFRVNAFARGIGGDPDAERALGGFTDFPRWMWRNTATRDFVEWLRTHNSGVQADVGFYGLDLYSLYPSIHEIQAYLDTADPQFATQVGQQYACFIGLASTSDGYGAAAAANPSRSCSAQARAARSAIETWAEGRAGSADPIQAEELFNLTRNAELVVNGEVYYRASYSGAGNTWNLRDTHMAGTVDAILEHLTSTGQPAKLVVWAHNSHVGDARATSQGDEWGQLTLGQLVRQRHPNTFLLGFTTYSGTVRAASRWGAAPELKQVIPALSDSYEAVFHATGIPNFLIPLHDPDAAPLGTRRLERAIGVIYLPQSERESHYFQADLTEQFDAVIHFDATQAVTPLDADQRANIAALRENAMID